MMRDVKANLVYFIFDHRFSVSVFWSIFMLSTSAMFLITLFSTNIEMGLSLEAAVYIFCVITGFVTTKETFPYLIKLGSTRNIYVVSMLAFHFLLSLFMTIVGMVVRRLINVFSMLVNMENFQVFSALDGTTLVAVWYNELLFNVLICYLLLAIGSVFGSMFYRFGLIGGFSSFVIALFIVIIPTTRNRLVDFLIDSNGFPLDLNYMSIILIAIGAIAPVYFLIRKASTTAGVAR